MEILLEPAGSVWCTLTLERETEIIYKCSDYYAPDCDRTVRFDSASLGIDWHLDDLKPVLSEKDTHAQDFSDFISPFL